MKRIYISDGIHKLLLDRSFQEGRTLQKVAEMALEAGLGTPTENTPLPENTVLVTPEKLRGKQFSSVTITEAVEKKSTGLTPRHKGDVLAEIRASEAERDEELRYCQDEEVGLEITGRWELHLKALWAEYNSLKGAE